MSANNRQVGGGHYRKGIQHWDFAAAQNMDYFQGQITKYICRWKDKNGIEDLRKARHFLDKYIELSTPGPQPIDVYACSCGVDKGMRHKPECNVNGKFTSELWGEPDGRYTNQD